LWSHMVERPVRSRNRGQESISYPPMAASEILLRIDTEIASLTHLDDDFPRFLERYQRTLAVAGRE
jgi:hypothetical protein